MPTPTIKWNNLVAQDRVKALLSHAFESGGLGHAYLFCGERGVGKFAAAVDLAMAVLCQCRDGDRAKPCGECSSCRKVSSYSHPDFHVIMPLCLEDVHKRKEDNKTVLSEEGWAFAAKSVQTRISDPYRLPQYDVIPDIPVEWVREADRAVMRGPAEGAAGVTIIDGVETMKKESANAMLKTLEEPPPGTLLILLTERAHGVLPTILSRCQTVRFPLLPPEVVGAELCGRFGLNAADGFPDSVSAAAAAGSLGLAISEYENPLDEYYEYAASLWGDCLKGDWGAAAAAADTLSSGKDSYTVCRNTVNCLIRLLRTAFLEKFGRRGASMNYITVESPGDTEAVVRLAQGALGGLDARGNAAMVMAGLVCSLMEVLNVQCRGGNLPPAEALNVQKQ